MNNKVAALAGGLVGALVIKGIHELVKKIDRDAPHFDFFDMEASKKQGFVGGESGTVNKLFSGGVTGDMFNNAIHNSITGLQDNATDIKDGLLGVASGLGAVYLPEVLGINKEHKGHSDAKHQVLATIYSLAGVFIAGKVVEWFTEKFDGTNNHHQLQNG